MAQIPEDMLIQSILGSIRKQEEFAFAGSDATSKDLARVKKLFGKARRWRFDWAFPEHRIAWEIDGGSWIGGRHSHGTGFEKDIEKLNTATLLGWRVIRSTTANKSKIAALEFIQGLINSEK